MIILRLDDKSAQKWAKLNFAYIETRISDLIDGKNIRTWRVHSTIIVVFYGADRVSN